MCSDAAPSWELRGEGLSRLSSLGPFRGPGVGRSAEPACGLKEGCPVRGGGACSDGPAQGAQPLGQTLEQAVQLAPP